MADAAYEIITSNPKKTNDQFFMDDEVLASVGVNDLSKYKINQNVPEHELEADFFC